MVVWVTVNENTWPTVAVYVVCGTVIETDTQLVVHGGCEFQMKSKGMAFFFTLFASYYAEQQTITNESQTSKESSGKAQGITHTDSMNS